jgi:hypothetical protein
MSQGEKPQLDHILTILSIYNGCSLWLIFYDTLGVRVVAGSNPAAPTNRNRGFVAQQVIVRRGSL